MIKTHSTAKNLSHNEAGLAEHFRWWLKLERHRNALTNQILDFFGCDDSELIMREIRMPFYELPNLHRGLRRVLRTWKLDLEGGDPNHYARRILWIPQRRKLPTEPGRSGEFVTSGSLFYKLPDGSKRAAILSEDHDPHQAHCVFIAPRSEIQSLRRDLKALAHWMKRHHPLRGRALRADTTFLDMRRQIGWDQIALPPEIRQKIWENTVGILKRREVYQVNGVPQRRGVLLYGPPGTGKTMVGKALAAESGATFIWVTAGDMYSTQCTRRIFRLARKLKPTILFLEDLDMYASDRNSSSSIALGELLTQMDGLEKNDGIVVVATTNDLAAVEPALRERPSRFDVVLEIGLPERPARRQILVENLRRQAPSDELLEAGAQVTAGLSGAQVREVAVLAIQNAISSGTVDSQGLAQLNPADFETALAQLTGKQKRQTLGFHTGC